MALVAKITQVGHERTIDNGDGTTSVDDLSLRGRFYVVADYFDSAAPTNILESQTFEFPQSTSVEEAQAAIVGFGQKVRDARVRANELKAFIGAVIPLT